MTGTVALLARYPVKSMMGEAVSTADLGPRGFVGDRAWGVIDRSDGKVASAKNPRKWSGLLQCRAHFVEPPGKDGLLPPVDIQFPDGHSCRSDHGDVDQVLSKFVGRDVTLAATAPDDRRFEEVWPDIEGLAPQSFIDSTSIGREPSGEAVSEIPLGFASPPGTFFDLSLVHLLTSATLSELGRQAPDATFDWRRYRPNLLVDVAASGFVEDGWSGREVQVGEATIKISMPTMRCVMTTLAQGDLAQDRATLRAIAATNRRDIPGLGTWACAGVYADVVRAGSVTVGDAVVIRPPIEG